MKASARRLRSKIMHNRRLARLLPLIGAGAVLLAAAPTFRAAPAAGAEGGDFRAAAAAPAAWRDFARQLQRRFQEKLAADTDRARQFQEDMAKRAGQPNAPRFVLNLRTWIEPAGRIARVEFDGFDDDPVAADNLRALLATADAGAPPPDMLQPLRLRLSLRPKDSSSRGE